MMADRPMGAKPGILAGDVEEFFSYKDSWLIKASLSFQLLGVPVVNTHQRAKPSQRETAKRQRSEALRACVEPLDLVVPEAS